MTDSFPFRPAMISMESPSLGQAIPESTLLPVIDNSDAQALLPKQESVYGQNISGYMARYLEMNFRISARKQLI